MYANVLQYILLLFDWYIYIALAVKDHNIIIKLEVILLQSIKLETTLLQSTLGNITKLETTIIEIATH